MSENMENNQWFRGHEYEHDKTLFNYPCDGCGKAKATTKMSSLVYVVLCQDCKEKKEQRNV